MKVCSKCKAEKPATSDFYHKDKSKKDGFRPDCKECVNNQYNSNYEKNKEHIQELRKVRQEELKIKYQEEIKSKGVVLKTCPACGIEKEASTNNFHRNTYMYDSLSIQCIECRSEYSKENSEYLGERLKEWYKNNPDKARRIWRRGRQKRRAKAKGLPRTLTEGEWSHTLDFFNNSCAYCGVSQDELSYNLHQDHIVPLSKGGGYEVSNIVPACSSCNSSKQAHDLLDWYREQDTFSIIYFNKVVVWQEYNLELV